MKSLFDELSDKIRQDPSLLRRAGPRQDLGLLLFNARDELGALWKAAERLGREGGPEAERELAQAADKLKYLFGER